MTSHMTFKPAHTSYAIEEGDVFGCWNEVMTYRTEEHALKAFPIFQRETRRGVRIVRVTREVADTDDATLQRDRQP